ncbi:Hpt domain-containing protein [Marinobacter caseinilyticus]|uniref:Hpt domain-containing protein n=1 Tax=Marinobacter caseinilyticus TaxID=2692195 RepID=UPI00140A85C1|nr:Hpt domain-containing protein [Marinobacter caseinilyticus]
MSDKPHLDEEALAELQDVMEDDFDVLIRTYIADSDERIHALRTALRNSDTDAFAKSAHSFKGSCINIGAPRLGALCSEAEMAGNEQRLERAEILLDTIETEFKTICTMLENSLES